MQMTINTTIVGAGMAKAETHLSYVIYDEYCFIVWMQKY
jgi:hypothetical protein